MSCKLPDQRSRLPSDVFARAMTVSTSYHADRARSPRKPWAGLWQSAHVCTQLCAVMHTSGGYPSIFISTNICGSDQHMVRGRTTAPSGLILGHEITGEVI